MEERSPRRYGEVFTQVNREGQQRLIAALQGLREAPTCKLLLGLRVDFYGELMNSALWPVTDGERVEIAPLRGAALREAIREPAEDQGVHREVGPLDQLMQDAAQEPGVLPLLQETMRAVDPARPAAADREGLRGAGERGARLSVALALTADAALSALKPEQRVIAKRILLRLVQFGEGRLDTRRQQPTAALRGESEALFQQVQQHLVEHRLLTMSRLCVSRRRAASLSPRVTRTRDR